MCPMVAHPARGSCCRRRHRLPADLDLLLLPVLRLYLRRLQVFHVLLPWRRLADDAIHDSVASPQGSARIIVLPVPVTSMVADSLLCLMTGCYRLALHGVLVIRGYLF